jgi:hypothetical protein
MQKYVYATQDRESNTGARADKSVLSIRSESACAHWSAKDKYRSAYAIERNNGRRGGGGTVHCYGTSKSSPSARASRPLP